jgi:hypothetical protein
MDRKPADRFSSDKEQADASLKSQLDFILANVDHLRTLNRGKKMEQAARSFKILLAEGENLTPGQRSYCEGIYETVMRAAGLEGVDRHVDKKRRSLKFG